MNDQELIEMSAKAAGFELDWDVPDGASPLVITGDGADRGPGSPWNALADDGDALRLAVKLRLSLTLNSWGAGVGGVDKSLRQVFRRVKCGGDGLPAAARRAIVSAAAEIGRAMP